ncbi:hypothetical protein QBD00_000183 [Ochrobactrum sp. AN78]|nr:hypothetical protein [Ochrobactrum sp. AN78]
MLAPKRVEVVSFHKDRVFSVFSTGRSCYITAVPINIESLEPL